jgi:tetratricopeptide (TPR) repeat protein
MSGRLKIAAIALALVVVAAVSPQVVSAWWLNLANVDIAHALFLPQDSPQRQDDLSDAESRVNLAHGLSDTGRVTLAQARVLLARGAAERALQTFDAADVSLGIDPIAQMVWADAARQANEPQVAIEHFRAAGAYVYFSQQMHRAVDNHQWQAAEDSARVAVGIDPNSADAHYVLADALARQDIQSPEAMSELDRAQELTRDSDMLSTIISRRGEIYASQGKLQDALDAFSQARTVAPIDARPRTDYAVTLLRARSDVDDQAVALLTEVVGDSPWYTAAYIALANIAERNGDLKGAEVWFEKGLARNANDPDLLFALGRFYARQRRLDEARSTLTLALRYETRPDNLQTIAEALAELK